MRMYDPPHPGLVLAENFDENFTVADAALKMGVPVQALTDIIEGKAPITPEIAFLLAGLFPYEPPEQWLELQADYDAWQANYNRQWQMQVLKKHNLDPSFMDGFLAVQQGLQP